MRLMGTDRMARLARRGGSGVAGAVSALCAEIEDARWDSPSSVAEMYPAATFVGRSVRIPVNNFYAIELLVDFDLGLVLVTFAGPASEAPRAIGANGRKAA